MPTIVSPSGTAFGLMRPRRNVRRATPFSPSVLGQYLSCALIPGPRRFLQLAGPQLPVAPPNWQPPQCSEHVIHLATEFAAPGSLQSPPSSCETKPVAVYLDQVCAQYLRTAGSTSLSITIA